jgi:hypothetical protein
VPSPAADQSSSRVAAVAAPELEASPAAAMPASPGCTADGNGDDLITTPQCNSQITATDPDGLMGNGPGGYIYGYDSAGNPTLTDASYRRSSNANSRADGGLGASAIRST